MRINELPQATSVAQTDELAIDVPGGRTYKVPRSILAPAPFVVTVPTGQWSGSGTDRYITVTASNVTANAMLYPFFDNDSSALLKGPVWCVPAAGSFTIHTSAIPSGTVTISVLLAGILGEAQYQVLADVYSKSQTYSKDQVYTKTETNTAIAQSTAGVAAGIAIHGDRRTASFSSLTSCTGNVVAVPEIILSGGYALMQGRVTINNYTRTSANPTVFVTIPNGKKVKHTFISIANGYTANESQVRLGELVNVQGNAGESVIRIFASETYTNFTGTRAFFVLSPFVFEIT